MEENQHCVYRPVEVYVCVNIFFPRTPLIIRSTTSNPTISAASLIMSALTSWRYQQQFLFQSLRYQSTTGNEAKRNAPKIAWQKMHYFITNVDRKMSRENLKAIFRSTIAVFIPRFCN